MDQGPILTVHSPSHCRLCRSRCGMTSCRKSYLVRVRVGVRVRVRVRVRVGVRVRVRVRVGVGVGVRVRPRRRASVGIASVGGRGEQLHGGGLVQGRAHLAVG